MVYATGIFLEYNIPPGSLNRFGGILEFTALICLVHCLYGFTFSYFSLSGKKYHYYAGLFHRSGAGSALDHRIHRCRPLRHPFFSLDIEAVYIPASLLSKARRFCPAIPLPRKSWPLIFCILPYPSPAFPTMASTVR
jgi:hypothetical protein